MTAGNNKNTSSQSGREGGKKIQYLLVNCSVSKATKRMMNFVKNNLFIATQTSKAKPMDDGVQ